MNALPLPDLLTLLAEAFQEPVERLTPETLREDVLGWDSLGALMLIAELDERFGVVLDPEESRRMLKIGDVLEFMRRHGIVRSD